MSKKPVNRPILGIDDLVGHYRAGGQLESSGSFTLDPKKARERLGEFQLPGPYHWILKVIQSLHLAGATEIEIDGGVSRVVVEANVVPGKFSSIDDVLLQLFAEKHQVVPTLHHLAAGLQGSLTVRPNLIEVNTVEDGIQMDHRLESGGWKTTKRQARQTEGEYIRIRLERNAKEVAGGRWFVLNTDIFDLMFRRQAALDREFKIVNEYCDYPFCNVSIGGRVYYKSSFGQPRFKGYEIREDPNPGITRAPTFLTMYHKDLVEGLAHVHHHLVEEVAISEEPGGFRIPGRSHATVTNREDPEIVRQEQVYGLSRACALRMELAGSGLLYFWQDGVLLGGRKFNANCPGFVALVDARNLTKDLTTLQVVEDEKYKRLIHDLCEVSTRLQETFLQNINRMPPSQMIRSKLGA